MPLQRLAPALRPILAALCLALLPMAARAGAVEDITAGYQSYSARNYDAAQQLFARALEDSRITPRARAVAHTGLGLCLVARLQFERAIQEYTSAIKADPGLPEAYEGRGSAYGCVNDYDRSVNDYDQAIRLRPDFALAYLNRGVTNSKRGYYRNALADYDRAIALNPNYALAFAKRAYIHKILGNQSQSTADARRARELDPGLRTPPVD